MLVVAPPEARFNALNLVVEAMQSHAKLLQVIQLHAPECKPSDMQVT